ncbi:hypothetical protein SAMN05878503_1338 [Cereibacter ovatus]|uniref:Uncharacterized protein n=1 Tax=Cereibacter ovatus TaxID=439529 RepID=A0A285D5J9_9RHOB|nr:hypothetical protein SAMN05878503_1338 [Cereibacter ovatus]
MPNKLAWVARDTVYVRQDLRRNDLVPERPNKGHGDFVLPFRLTRERTYCGPAVLGCRQRIERAADQISRCLHYRFVPWSPDQVGPVTIELPRSIENARSAALRFGWKKRPEATSLFTTTDRHCPRQWHLLPRLDMSCVGARGLAFDLGRSLEDLPSGLVGSVTHNGKSVFKPLGQETGCSPFNFELEGDSRGQEQQELCRKIGNFLAQSVECGVIRYLRRDDRGRPAPPACTEEWTAFGSRVQYLSKSHARGRCVLGKTKMSSNAITAGFGVEAQSY